MPAAISSIRVLPKETDDPDVVAATMSKPGVVLKRAAGSNGRFAEQAGLPTDLGDEGGGTRRESRRPEPKRRSATKISEKAARKAAADFDREQKRRDARAPEAARRSAPGARSSSCERRRSPIRRSGSTKKGLSLSMPNEPRSRSVSRPKTPGGRARRRSCWPLCVGRGTRIEAPTGGRSTRSRDTRSAHEDREGDGPCRRGVAQKHHAEYRLREHHGVLRNAAAQGRRSRIGTPPGRGGSSSSPSRRRSAARMSASRMRCPMPGISRNAGQDSTANSRTPRTRG